MDCRRSIGSDTVPVARGKVVGIRNIRIRGFVGAQVSLKFEKSEGEPESLELEVYLQFNGQEPFAACDTVLRDLEQYLPKTLQRRMPASRNAAAYRTWLTEAAYHVSRKIRGMKLDEYHDTDGKRFVSALVAFDKQELEARIPMEHLL